jgi:hypothetical protein
VNFVLDTNAASETVKPRPNPGFIAWHDAQDPAHLFITTVTLAEVWNGFHSLRPEHLDYERIKLFASDLPRKYRVLNFDARAAAIWGELTAHATGPSDPEEATSYAYDALNRLVEVVDPDGGTTLRQLATFNPRGVAGRLYWWVLLPIHTIIWKRLAERLVARTELEQLS